MNYVLMIYGDEADHAAPGTPKIDKFMAGYMAVTTDMKESGKFVAGDPLQGVATATTVRVPNSNNETTDDPFAETKEQP